MKQVAEATSQHSSNEQQIPQGWQEVALGDVVRGMVSGVSVNGDDVPASEQEQGVLKVSAVSYGIFDPRANKRIVAADLSRAKVQPIAGAIIISRANTPELVGASAYIPKDFPNLFLPDKLWQITPDKANADTRWLAFVLSSSKIRALISDRATGTSGGMKNIAQSAFLKIPILLPPLPEQIKIAAILSTWDESIATLTKLLAAKQQQKHGLAEALLTGKRRLPGFVGKWEEVRLGDVAEFLNRGKAPTYTEEATSIFAVNQKCVRDGKVNLDFARRHDKNKNIPDNVILRDGDICINSTGTGTAGRVGLFENRNVKCSYFPDTHVTLLRCKKSQTSPKFVTEFLLLGKTQTIIENECIQGSSNQVELGRGEFANLTISLPPLSEQRAIASILSTLDAEISALTRLKASLLAQKRGLMDVLLTGRVRVSV